MADKLISDFDEAVSVQDTDLFLTETDDYHKVQASTLKDYVLEDVEPEVDKLADVSKAQIDNAVSQVGKLADVSKAQIDNAVSEVGKLSDVSKAQIDNAVSETGKLADVTKTQLDSAVSNAEKLNDISKAEIEGAVANGEKIAGYTAEQISAAYANASKLENITAEDLYNAVHTTEPVYGICINHATASPTLERCGAAVGLVAEVANGNNTPRNDFDYIYPWCDIHKCTVSDNGTITANYGDANYVEDGSIGQVMSYIPKHYIRRYIDETASKEYILICKKQLDGFVLPKCFYNKNGNEIDYVLVAAYPSAEDEDGKAQSIAGQTLDDIGMYKFSAYTAPINARAGEDEETGERIYPWHSVDIHELNMLQMLFMVEFATTDSESIFGGMYDEMGSEDSTIDTDSSAGAVNEFESSEAYGNGNWYFVGQEIYIGTNGNSYTRHITSLVGDDENEVFKIGFDGEAITFDGNSWFSSEMYVTGCTNKINASSGNLFPSNEYGQGCIPFKWRGIENLFSFDYTWCEGILIQSNTNGGNYCVTDNQSLYGDNSSIAEYDDIGISPPVSGFISKMTFIPEKPLIMVAEEANGTDMDGYCDKATKATTAPLKAYRFGGGSVGVGGVFAAYANNTNNANNTGCVRLSCSRLMFSMYGNLHTTVVKNISV